LTWHPRPRRAPPAAKIHQKNRTGTPHLRHNYQPGQLDGLPRIDSRTTNKTALHNTPKLVESRLLAKPATTTNNWQQSRLLPYTFNFVADTFNFVAGFGNKSATT